METSDSGSGPEEVQTLRSMTGLRSVPEHPLTFQQCMAKAHAIGVTPEHARATYRLFGDNGPKPDDPLTPQQVQDVRTIFEIFPEAEIPLQEQVRMCGAIPTAHLVPEQDEAEVPEQEPADRLCCQICFRPYGPFKKPCGHMVQVQVFPYWEWQERGCVCPTVEICLECVQKEAFTSARRCCQNPLCNGIQMKCPWCREDVEIGDCFYKWVLANGDPESKAKARAVLQNLV